MRGAQCHVKSNLFKLRLVVIAPDQQLTVVREIIKNLPIR